MTTVQRLFWEPVNGLTHLFGALLALIGVWWLAQLTLHDPHKFIPAMVFGVSMVIVYLSSTVLHLVKCSDRRRLWLNRLDHASIYTLIAGTYTPILYHGLSGVWRWEVLGGMWALAGIGMLFKMFLLYEDTIWSTGYYIVTGVSGFVLAGPELFRNMPISVMGLMIAGGIVYLIGAVIFATRRPNLHPMFGHHELWHLFVLLASSLHFIGIAILIL